MEAFQKKRNYELLLTQFETFPPKELVILQDKKTIGVFTLTENYRFGPMYKYRPWYDYMQYTSDIFPYNVYKGYGSLLMAPSVLREKIRQEIDSNIPRMFTWKFIHNGQKLALTKDNTYLSNGYIRNDNWEAIAYKKDGNVHSYANAPNGILYTETMITKSLRTGKKQKKVVKEIIVDYNNMISDIRHILDAGHTPVIYMKTFSVPAETSS